MAFSSANFIFRVANNRDFRLESDNYREGSDKRIADFC
jgi:hypothetical protein